MDNRRNGEMSWAIAMPAQFGVFFPDGNYVGWEEKLADYFNNDMPADKKALFNPPVASRYASFVADSFIHEPGTKRPGWPPLLQATASSAPSRFVTSKKYSSLASLIILNDRLLAVDSDLRQLIENIEPGKHNFFPIELFLQKKVKSDKDYFIFVVGQFCDSFDPSASNPNSWEYFEDGTISVPDNKLKDVALARARSQGRHVWRERRFAGQTVIFISEELKRQLDVANLRVPAASKVKEV
jgi:hypothetical protein